ncbi:MULTISPECIES: helix-turn-helix domain-containing protein [unclassified Saccharopolyspora]|uniref:helix-turn-helix domain-containing protein n=1 Tax=unclassified Saccharopolyspora TaxID=2646250 RepID=UPI001CD71B80|nr:MULTISPECIES: helix-turn-helix domain-containing protein [unclassified Saccharopolyspora]MCA1185624.1 GAF domain-containing protein [Saccharopolyspora sp. 6T]MCA1191519.1 GAF domain-containing protein [Saccharopolyspora sp. 6V]MCA1226808.1 GAF domain-containing protein [Saccharopolyspora sp. 6M]MCA1280680.1 GAF domain-containing protein [Saccharopolyspora sp. 7B]
MKRTDDIPADPMERARLLRRVHSAVLAGERAPHAPRPVVFESWRRSLAASVDPDRVEPPMSFDVDRLAEIRAAHPIAACVPLLRRTLLDAADGTTHIMVITDAEGNILWREGHPNVCRAADRVRLSEGTTWSETSMGTNAMGTTLATGRPVQIHSAEHLVRRYHSWTCAASPVHDPETGRILGSIDISGPLHTMHPALAALVAAATTLVESTLREWMARRDERLRERNMGALRALRGEPGALLSATGRVVAAEPGDLALPERVELDRPEGALLLGGREARIEPLDDGYLLRAPRAAATGARSSTAAGRDGQLPPTLRLRFLTSRPTAELRGREVSLSPRRAELLAVLALSPDGLNAEQLALALHGEQGNPVTVRAEIHRLRTQLGHDVVQTKPYRIAAEVDADFLQLRAALRAGRLDPALELHRGALLPSSEAPAVREEREDLLAGLRGAVLSARDPELLWRLADGAAGRDDIEVHEALLVVLPAQDWRRPTVAARLHRLLHDPA